jgi:hypothetical protein
MPRGRGGAASSTSGAAPRPQAPGTSTAMPVFLGCEEKKGLLCPLGHGVRLRRPLLCCLWCWAGVVVGVGMDVGAWTGCG